MIDYLLRFTYCIHIFFILLFIKGRTTGCREQERGLIIDHLCYGCGSKEHKIQKCNKKNNIFVIFVTNNERHKMKEEEMSRIIEEYEEVKSLKVTSATK